MNLTIPKNSTLITECFANASSDYLKSNSEKLSAIYRVYYGWISLPVVCFAFIFTIIYIAAVYRAIKLRRVSRKCYVLLLNRALGDLLGCFVGFAIVSYALLATKPNRDVMQLMDVFFIGTFWAAMVSYVSLSILKLYAIARPLHYRNNITIRRCIYLIILSWVVLILLTLYSLITTALVKIPFLNEWSGCKVETCLRTMYRARNFLLVIVYFFTIICFLLTVLFVKRARKSANSFHQKSTQKDSIDAPQKKKFKLRFPLWKLALNVGTFTIFNLLYVIFALFLLKNRDKCFFLHNFEIMFRLLGSIRCSLLLRILIDPLLSFLTDDQIRRSALAIFGISKQVFPFLAFSRRTTESNESNSSEMGPTSSQIKTSALSEKIPQTRFSAKSY